VTGQVLAGRGPRRGAVRLLVVAGALLLVFGWLTPNAAAGWLAAVRVYASCDGGTPVAAPHALPCDGRLRVTFAVEDHYLLPVTASFDGPAFAITLSALGPGAAATPAWAVSADDPALEEGSDSPAGGGSRAALIAPGVTWPSVPGLAAQATLDLGTSRIPQGTYALRVTAYGLTSTPLQVIVGPHAVGVP
jgi:hypothetical protein